jgi:hypothetical protein
MGENQNFGDGGDGELMNMYIDELWDIILVILSQA